MATFLFIASTALILLMLYNTAKMINVNFALGEIEDDIDRALVGVTQASELAKDLK